MKGIRIRRMWYRCILFRYNYTYLAATLLRACAIKLPKSVACAINSFIIAGDIFVIRAQWKNGCSRLLANSHLCIDLCVKTKKFYQLLQMLWCIWPDFSFKNIAPSTSKVKLHEFGWTFVLFFHKTKVIIRQFQN